MSEGNGYVTREDILGASAVRFCDFDIPADFPIESLAGKKIRLRSLNAKEKVSYEEFFVNPATGKDDAERGRLYREKLTIECVVDGSGARLFTLDDIRTLSKVDGALMQAIADRAVRHNRFDALEDMKKKPEPIPDSSSS